MSIVYTPLFTSSLIIVPSRMFRMYGFYSFSTTVFPARTTFCNEMRGLTTFALLNVMHRVFMWKSVTHSPDCIREKQLAPALVCPLELP